MLFTCSRLMVWMEEAKVRVLHFERANGNANSRLMCNENAQCAEAEAAAAAAVAVAVAAVAAAVVAAVPVVAAVAAAAAAAAVWHPRELKDLSEVKNQDWVSLKVCLSCDSGVNPCAGSGTHFVEGSF